MSIHTFHILFRDGAHLIRTEWGRNRKQALKTLEGIYGKENFIVLA